MTPLNGTEQYSDDEFFPISNAIFTAMLPWLPTKNDAAMLALMGEVVMLATYGDDGTGRHDRAELRASLRDMLDEFLEIAFENK